MTVRPHLRDHFAGYVFSPAAIAPVADGAWVADQFLPVVVRVDAPSGRMSQPCGLEHGKANSMGIRGLVAFEGALWASWDGAVSRFDPTAGRTTAVFRTDRWDLACGEGAVWSLAGDGNVLRFEPSGDQLHRIGDPEFGRTQIAVGHGSVWTLGWGKPQARETILTRLDPRSGSVQLRLLLDGQVGSLAVDSTGVWATLTRWTSPREVARFIHRIDPGTNELARVWEARPQVSASLVVDGVIWTPASPSERELPGAMMRLSAATGEVLGATVVDGRLSRPVAGASGIWAQLRRSDARRTDLAWFPKGDQETKVLELGHVDIGRYVPPPPPPIEAEPQERAVRDQVERILAGGWTRTDPDTGTKTKLPFITGISVDAVTLQGEFPDTEVVIFFRSDRHPSVLFGRRRPIWEANGELSGGDASIITINLMEDITACGHGLPTNPLPDTTGIVWF